MDNEIRERLEKLETKIEAIWVSVEKTRKYFKATLWITIILFVLPLVLLFFAIPAFLTNYLGSIDSSALDLYLEP